MIVHSVPSNTLRDTQIYSSLPFFGYCQAPGCKYKEKIRKTTDFCSEFYGFLLIILFLYYYF
mgnify:CR=1 FL=1